MNYIVTKKENLDIDGYTIIDEDSCKSMLNSGSEFIYNHDNFLYCDSETTGLSSVISELLTFQIKFKNDTFVIDCTTIDIKVFKEILENRTILFHSAKFDLQFLYKNDIWPFKLVQCTLIRQSIINAGYDEPLSLAHLVNHYTKNKLDKSARSIISKKNIYEPRFIEYAAKDVAYLREIYCKQQNILDERELNATYSLEKIFTPVLAYTEFCGFKLSIEKWKEKLQINEAECQIAWEKLNQESYNIGLCPPTLFDICSINWNSPAQVIETFKSLNIDLRTSDGNLSVERKVIEKYNHIPVIKAYLDFKSKSKILSSYGYNYLNLAESFPDNRIRTAFSQLKKTGRMSGAEKDDSTDFDRKDKVNLQNIPRIVKADDKNPGNEYKSERLCFVPNEGNVFIVADYSQQEQVIMANQSKDETLLNFFRGESSDMHCFVAKNMYKQLEGKTEKEIKQEYPQLRQYAKGAGFCLNYNGRIEALSENLQISLEEAQDLYDRYFAAFPGLKKLFNIRINEGTNKGYIITNPVTKRRIYFDSFKVNNELRGVDWSLYKQGKSDPSSIHRKYYENVYKLLKKKSNIANQSVNFPIQSTAADCTKLAAVKIFDYIRRNNLLNIVLICNIVHDEIVLECPESLANTMSMVVKTCMEEAASKFCPIIPIKADPIISKKWHH